MTAPQELEKDYVYKYLVSPGEGSPGLAFNNAVSEIHSS